MNVNRTTDGMTIGDLAGRAGVTAKTVRYYEQIGLLPSPPRTRSGYRRYGEEELLGLQFIVKAKNLGLSLDEIRGVLAITAAGADPCPHVVGLIDRHVGQVDETLARLSEFREQLAKLRADAERATKGRVCGIIEHADPVPAAIVGSFTSPLARQRRRRRP